MSNLASLSRNALAATALAVAAAGLTAVPALAAPPGYTSDKCVVQGESPSTSGSGETYEWSIFVTFRSKGVSCAQAKAVVNQCAVKDTVPGWKVSKNKGKIQFTNRSSTKRRFVTTGAGGSPRCISKYYETHGY